MCRLLAVRSDKPFKIDPFLDELKEMAERSEIDQGDGWGVCYLENGKWQVIKEIDPIWESQLGLGISTTIMLAHARSAFHEHEIRLENNMPFIKDDLAFIFNGELHGVKIKESGNTGAEKIFNLIHKLSEKGIVNAIDRTLKILNLRSDYIRASNLVISDGINLYSLNTFNEDSSYFTLYKSISNDLTIITSERFGEFPWKKLEMATVEVL